MKPSEFYEKYWRINGEPPPPLMDAEKEYLDNHINDTWVGRIEFYRHRKRYVSVNVDILKEDMKKLPPFLNKPNNP